MRKRITALWSNEFIKGSVWITLSFTFANFLNYIFTVFAGRQLGPDGYGEIVAMFSYISIFSVPISVITTIVVQKISEADENGHKVASRIELFFKKMVIRFWYVLVLPLLVIPLLPSITNLSPVTAYFLFPIFFAMFIFMFYGSIIQGLRLFFLYAFINIISPFIKLIGPFAGYIGGDTLTIILLFTFLAFSLPSVLGYFLYRKQVRETGTKSDAVIERSLRSILFRRQFAVVTISILAMTLLNNFDIIFVKKFFTSYEAGIYGSWSLFAKIILYAVGPLSSVSFVFFSSKKQSENHRITLLVSIGMLVVVGLVSYAGYTLFARQIIVSLFGDRYVSVIPYLGQASIFGTVYSIITFVNSYFLAKKSNEALILPAFIPVYIVGLIAAGRTLESIMRVNIYFTVFILLVYGIFFFVSEKKRK